MGIKGDANIITVNFLDATLDLRNGKHYPYTKKGNTPPVKPPTVHIKKNIPKSINKRLSKISSDKECFMNAKVVYPRQKQYKYDLTYKESDGEPPHHARNISWYMVSVLDSGSNGLGLGPGRGHCVVFLGQTLNSHGA